MADNKWIQNANLKKGAFTRWAERQGYDTSNGIPKAAIEEGKNSNNKRVVGMALLAATFQKMSKK